MFIIVKHARSIPKDVIVARESAYDGYFCAMAGIEGGLVYPNPEDAAHDLALLDAVDPGGGFGLARTTDQ